jgi:hypothetical protein
VRHHSPGIHELTAKHGIGRKLIFLVISKDKFYAKKSLELFRFEH